MKNSEEVKMSEVVAVIRDNFESLRTLEDLSSGSELHRDLGLDSLDIVRLQVAIEDHFDVRFDPIRDDLAEAFLSAGSLLKLIRSLVKGKNQ